MTRFTGMVTKLTFGAFGLDKPVRYSGLSIVLRDLGREKDYLCYMKADSDGKALSSYVFLLTAAMINGYEVETIQDEDTGLTTGVRILPI